MNWDATLGPGYGRIIHARQALEEACTTVVEMAREVDDFAPIGTAELPAALAALESSDYVDEDESGARWVSEAFTATPTELIQHGMAALAFGGAVIVLRGALHELDQAIAAAGTTGPGGTFSA